MLKVILLCFLITLPYQSDPEPINGRFIAFDTLQGLTNPREPIQRFIVEVQDKQPSTNVKLLKVVYFAPSGSIRGSEKFLGKDILDYKNVWRLKLHPPLKDKEKAYCRDSDNYWRAADGTIDADEKNEPMLRYRSTRFDARIKFEGLREMPCMILESMN